MRTYLTFLLLSLFTIADNITAQTTFESRKIIINKSATVKVSEIKEDWDPSLQNLEMPIPGSGSSKSQLMELKEQVKDRYKNKTGEYPVKRATPATPPYLLNNFQGNAYNNSVPNDNDIAISNSGKLISVINSSIYIFDVNQDSLLQTFSLDAFSTVLGISGSKFDPKVLYDPTEDKFIIVFLNGFTDSTSYVIAAFSESADPLGSWNLYSLPGDPLNNSLWSDYPMVAVTEKEFFLTINLLYNNMSWQLGFAETIIWQINKESGYTGQTLNSVMHNGIQHSGTPVRNLCPIKGGNYVYGPNMYFLSNKNLSVESDTIFLVEITDTINSLTGILTVALLSAANHYFLPPTARQSSSHTFETNDSRVLGGFLENGQIQFVQNTRDTSTGFAGIYHGIITGLTSGPVVTATTIGDSILDLGYPNISYTGDLSGDNSSMITFNHTAPNVFSGFSALRYDNNGDYSNKLTIKNGLNYVHILAGFYERWGDYSGSQRKYNEPGKIWVSGSYGTSNKRNSTWIAELGTTSTSAIAQYENDSFILNLFPNPTNDIVSLNFHLKEDKKLDFKLYDSKGNYISTLLNEVSKKGENQFSFSTVPLAPGIYFLRTSSNKEVIFNKKIIKN